MIECRGVSFSYDGAAPALDGVDLNIEDGEFFCILGGNGSGKSTFAKHLNALLQPDAGTVRINGMDASDPELVYDIRSTAGMVFQNPDDQLVATLVEDDGRPKAARGACRRARHGTARAHIGRGFLDARSAWT